MVVIKEFVNSFVFWAAWIIIPLIMEIIPAIGSFFILIKRKFFSKKSPKPIIYPEISVIIPVYNSESTLEACIKSVNDCDYPNNKIRVFLVNNHGTDNSFQIYTQCQKKYPDLIMQWLNAEQGKSRALNLALYNSEGKYIVHIDSDGVLEKSALSNMVDMFEADTSVNCMTGAIMIEPQLVEQYKPGPSRLFRKMEFMEYAQAFLAGRNYASDLDSIYTVSGAFSAFRKSAILKSRLYNTETLAEDTQITFQMRYIQGERIYMCENAIFFVDPIENVDKLYTQRQRWQRGSLEVSQMFVGQKMKSLQLFSDVAVKTLMYDHTFAFPRIIWYLALICLMFVGYSGKMVVLATAAIFALYILCGYLYFASTVGFLSDFPEVKHYYLKQWWVVPLLPFFNFVVFFIRFAGIINSINTGSAWKTKTLTEEGKTFVAQIKEDKEKLRAHFQKWHDAVNDDPKKIYAPKSTVQKARGTFLGYFLTIAGLLFSITLVVVCDWSFHTFSVRLNEIVNTIMGPMVGAGNDMLNAGLKACLPPVLLCVAVITAFLIADRLFVGKMKKEISLERKNKKAKRILLAHRIVIGLSICSLLFAFWYGDKCYDVKGFVSAKLSNSSFYEQYYVDPKTVSITCEGTPRNLIYIYLESMETTYASEDAGGFQKINYMPELTKLAKEHISFSKNEKMSGFYSCYGATWTMGAIYTTTSGIPYALPIKDTQMKDEKVYASGLTTLGDILQEKGYYNEFLCGSDAEFGGRKLYFTQHGDYQIFDYYSAKEQGYIAPNYYVWWGLEDEKLYREAKDEATRLSERGEPFNLTLLTVDTHATDGYLCDLCGNEYEEKTANVVKCADKQVAEFVRWCMEQPFYENTTIVITGDHPRMDNSLVEGAGWYDRTVYNCFINVPNAENAVTKNRESTTFDMFPTILSALGYDIEGERLGLGTNLFSPQRTLVETMGIDPLETELQKHSDYYVKTFAPELVNVEN